MTSIERERESVESVEPKGVMVEMAVITINKQLSLCLDSTGLADLPQMSEQLKDCLARGDHVSIS